MKCTRPLNYYSSNLLLLKNNLFLFVLFAAAVLCTVFMAGIFANNAKAEQHESTSDNSLSSSNDTQNNQVEAKSSSSDKPGHENEENDTFNSTIVRDSILLTGEKVIPSKDFIHIYDSTPYMIMSGHVAAKLPCNEQFQPMLQILIGQAPDIKPVDLEIVSELSTAGENCLYHVDLNSNAEIGGRVITDIALFNPNEDSTTLGETGTVIVGINEIAPLGEKHHAHSQTDTPEQAVEHGHHEQSNQEHSNSTSH